VAGYLIGLVNLLALILEILLIAYALISFTPLEPWHPVRRFLDQVVEPLLNPIRRNIPSVGVFDFSVMVALVIVWLAQQVLVTLIMAVFH
jgi:YggT family protein